MPHHVVIRDYSTTTCLRVVFDASSHTQVVASLNDHLEKELNITNDLMKMLANFRLPVVGLTADDQKAFRPMCTHEEHRDALCYFVI